MFSTSIYKQLNSRIEYTKVGNFCFIQIWQSINELLLVLFAVKFIFFFLNFLVYFNFMLVSRKWPGYVVQWENAERKFMELQILQYQNMKVKQRIKKILVFVTLVAFSELKFEVVFVSEELKFGVGLMENVWSGKRTDVFEKQSELKFLFKWVQAIWGWT